MTVLHYMERPVKHAWFKKAGKNTERGEWEHRKQRLMLGDRPRNMAGAPYENKHEKRPNSSKSTIHSLFNRLARTECSFPSHYSVWRTAFLGEWLRWTAARRFRFGCFGMKTGVPVRFLDEMGSREGCLPAILCYIKNKQKETKQRKCKCH